MNFGSTTDALPPARRARETQCDSRTCRGENWTPLVAVLLFATAALVTALTPSSVYVRELPWPWSKTGTPVRRVFAADSPLRGFSRAGATPDLHNPSPGS